MPSTTPSPSAATGPGAARTIVLGATGRLGRMVRAHWTPDGEANNGAPGNVLWQARRPVAGHVTCALEETPALCALLEGAGTIVMLAGVVPGRSAPLEANVTLAEAVMRAARPGTRVLLASSAAIYGRGSTDERTPPHPLSAYGRAMARREEAAAQIGAARGVALCALRIGNVAGADAALGGWSPGFTLDLFPDGRTPRRSYLGPRDLAEALAALCRHEDPLPAALNLAAPGVVAMNDLLESAGLDYETRPAPAEALAEVRLCTHRLARHIDLPPPATAPGLVAQWRAWQKTPETHP